MVKSMGYDKIIIDKDWIYEQLYRNMKESEINGTLSALVSASVYSEILYKYKYASDYNTWQYRNDKFPRYYLRNELGEPCSGDYGV